MDKTDKLIDWKEDERNDRRRDGIDDDIEPPIPDVTAATANLANRLNNDGLADSAVTGGDLDAQLEGAQFSGDESPVSSMTSPEHNDVDDIGRAMGIQYSDVEELRVGEKERSRDKHRWELDPASSDDYNERVRDES